MLSTKIGTYPISKGTIEFFLDDERVTGKQNGEVYPVELPNCALLNKEYLPTAEKVQRVLRNRLLHPVVEGRQIVFKAASETIEWMTDVKPLQESPKGWTARRDGSISYFFERSNTVMTWNIKEDRWIPEMYPTFKMSAIAEMWNGKLVIGDVEGDLYYEGKKIPTSLVNEISQITPLSETEVFVRTGNVFAVVDLHTHCTVLDPMTNCKQCFPLSDGTIVWLSFDNKASMVQKVEGIYESIPFHSETGSIFRVLNTKNTFLLNVRKSAQLIVFENGKNTKNFESIHLFGGAEYLYFKDEKYIGVTSRDNVCQVFEDGREELIMQGSTCQPALTLISNGSLVCSTHLLDGKVNIILDRVRVHQAKIDWGKASFMELVDGSVACLAGRDLIVIKPVEKHYTRRLFVGEGNFSYTVAVVNKYKIDHPGLVKRITATEFLPTATDKVAARCSALMEQGVNVLFGIDGTRLEKHFPGERFERIQWNCPFGSSGVRADEFKGVVPDFFKSASHLQLPGDRVHVTIMQGAQAEKRLEQNPIFEGARKAGYRQTGKRDISKRYPKYEHVKTGSHEKFEYAGEYEREFIFEKLEQELSEPQDIKKRKVGSKANQLEQNTDDEASEL